MGGTRLIYLMDPHCGWCFGYSATIAELYDRVIEGSEIELSVVPGGLFIPRKRISPEFIDSKRPIAKRIGEQFGVEFSPSYFSDVLGGDYSIDSTPPCLGVCAANLIDDSKSLHFCVALTRAAFVDGRNISKPHVVVEVAAEQGFEAEEFRSVVGSKAAAERLNQSLELSLRVGTGFPSLFLDRNGKVSYLGGANLTVRALERTINTI